MTTIAYTNGVMACDSLWTLGDKMGSFATKIVRTRHGCLIGAAGTADSREIEKLLDKVKTPDALPTTAELASICAVSSVLMVFPDGRMFHIDTDVSGKKDDVGVIEILGFTHSAIGSGAPFARTAMQLGKSAEEAVEIATMFDMYSRKPVHSLKLGPNRRKK